MNPPAAQHAPHPGLWAHLFEFVLGIFIAICGGLACILIVVFVQKMASAA
jgi:hypothetical protein